MPWMVCAAIVASCSPKPPASTPATQKASVSRFVASKIHYAKVEVTTSPPPSSFDAPLPISEADLEESPPYAFVAWRACHGDLCAFHAIAPLDDAVEPRAQADDSGTCFGTNYCHDDTDCDLWQGCEGGDRVTSCHFGDELVDCECRLDGVALETFQYDPSREIVSCRTAENDCLLGGVWQ